MSTSMTLVSVMLIGSFGLSDGHALLLEPPSRNFVAHRRDNHAETCPHCLQSGGPGQVKARGSGIWPTVLDPASHGLCGDPAQGTTDPASFAVSPYLQPTPVQRTYRAGQVVEFRIGVNAHHKGHYEFRVCDKAIDGATLSSAKEGQDCLNKWVLERAPLDSSCTGQRIRADCQPIDEKHPGRWYLPPPSEGTLVAGNDWTDDNGKVSAVTEYHVMKYKIPDHLTCTHCTLQWYYSTGNTCMYDTDYLGPEGYFQREQASFQALGWNPSAWCSHCMSNWATCENACCKTGGTFGEEFWNCADIAITSGDGPMPTTSSPVTTPSPETTTPQESTTRAPRMCSARSGNAMGATDAKCGAACSRLPAGVWPCTDAGPCDCSGAAETTTTTASPALCAGSWSQCGGKGWTGTTCCVGGNSCTIDSEWYSQCKPV